MSILLIRSTDRIHTARCKHDVRALILNSGTNRYGTADTAINNR